MDEDKELCIMLYFLNRLFRALSRFTSSAPPNPIHTAFSLVLLQWNSSQAILSGCELSTHTGLSPRSTSTNCRAAVQGCGLAYKKKQNAWGVTSISQGDPEAPHPGQLQVSVCDRQDAHLLVTGQGKVLLEMVCRRVEKPLCYERLGQVWQGWFLR